MLGNNRHLHVNLAKNKTCRRHINGRLFSLKQQQQQESKTEKAGNWLDYVSLMIAAVWEVANPKKRLP